MDGERPTQKPNLGGLRVERGTTAIVEENLPPVVARMVVEIRSDGTKTVARGALEDLQTGEKVALRADAATPVALAKELTKTILNVPTLAGALAKEAVKNYIPEPLKRLRAFSKKNK